MALYHDTFTQRQTMNRRDFEFYHYLDLEPPTVGFHHHDFYEVLFFVSGAVTYTVEGRSYLLRPGDILLTNNRDIHRPEIAPGKPYERYVLWITGQILEQIQRPGDDLTACFRDAAQKQYRLIRPGGDALAQLQRLCRRILHLQREDAFGSATLLYAAVAELLVYLNRAYFDTPSAIRQDVTESEAVNRAVAHIEVHLTEELTLDSLAEAVHLSKFYLNRQFKQYTGLTIHQFILKKRLITARTMLRSGVSAMDACMGCGFNDYSNFLKAFKREFGRSPRQIMAP